MKYFPVFNPDTAKNMLSLAFFLLLFSVSSHAQSGDPLYIALSGNVGIGTNTPQQRLHVSGSMLADTVLIKGIAGRLEVNGTSFFSDKLDVSGPAFFSSRLAIGVNDPRVRLDVARGEMIGTSGTSVSQHDPSNRGVKIQFGSVETAGNAVNEFTGMKIDISGGTKGCGNASNISFHTWECNTSMSREIMRITGTGNVGIGTTSPNEKLEVTGNVKVNGAINATTLNGEKPPLIFKIQGDRSGKNWQSLKVDGSIIEQYLGDEDGGTVKFLITRNDGSVRIRTETIYIGKKAASGSIPGWTRQLGGGEWQFTLNNNGQARYVDAAEGMYMRNFHDPGYTLPKEDGKPWTGTDAYKVEFLMHKDLASCTIIIYDR